MKKHFLYGWICLMVSVAALATGPVLNDVKRVESQSHFRVAYQFSNEVDPKNVSVEFINNTVQINVKGAELNQDKRFDKVKDPMVKNLYSFKSSRESLALRINYTKKHTADNFKERVEFKVDGKKLMVSIADGRAIALGTLNNILEKPSNLNTQKVEDKYKYLQMKLTGEESEERAEVPKANVPSVLSADRFEEKLADKLKFDQSDSIKDDVPSIRDLPKKRKGPIRVRKVRGVSSTDKEKVLIEEDVSLTDEKKKKESEIPVFSKPQKAKALENSSPINGLATGLFILLAIGGVSYLALRRYTSKKLKESKHQTIKVLTQHHLGPRKSLAIIRVAGESVLIGVTDHNINLIKPLSLMDDELPESQNPSFDQRLNNANVNEELGMGLDFQDDDEDEFAVHGLKEMVKNRLSGMKEL